MRRCCEQTLRIMRENKESLLTIIEVTDTALRCPACLAIQLPTPFGSTHQASFIEAHASSSFIIQAADGLEHA
jgi:hypothetical protein